MPNAIILLLYTLKFSSECDSVSLFDNLKFIPVYRVYPSRTFVHLFAFFSYVFFYWILLVLLYSYLKYFCLHANLCKYLQTKKRRNVCVKEKERDSEKERAVQKANSIRTTVSCWKRKVVGGKKQTKVTVKVPTKLNRKEIQNDF